MLGNIALSRIVCHECRACPRSAHPRPGLQTSVQDYPGRTGLWRVGVPPSGPMDSLSHRLANALVGNDEDAATLEFGLTGAVGGGAGREMPVPACGWQLACVPSLALLQTAGCPQP